MSKKQKTVISVAHLLPHPQMTVGQAALALLKREGNRFVALSRQAGTSEDPEVVHDMRVACRRIRVALKDFSEFLPKWVLEMDADFKGIFENLGKVRDLDVQILSLQDMCPDSHAKKVLLRTLECEREKAREALGAGLVDERFGGLVGRLERLSVLNPQELSESAELSLGSVAPEILQARFKKVSKLAEEVHSQAAVKTVHDFRKSSKRFRYSLEMVSPAYGKPAKRVMRRLKRLQDGVGAYIDAQIAIDRLRMMLDTAPLDTPSSELAKDLIELHQHRADETIGNLSGPWKQIEGAPWKKLKRKMKRVRKKVGVESKSQGSATVTEVHGLTQRMGRIVVSL